MNRRPAFWASARTRSHSLMSAGEARQRSEAACVTRLGAGKSAAAACQSGKSAISSFHHSRLRRRLCSRSIPDSAQWVPGWAGWPNRYGGMARKGPEPAMCNKRDEYEMVLPRKRRECGSGDADGRRHCHTLCTHGVRASVVMLQGEPVSEQTSGGRPRGAGGTADELCMAGQQPACDRRPQPRSLAAGSSNALADGIATLSQVSAQP